MATLFSLPTDAFLDGFLRVCPNTSIPKLNRGMNTASIIHFMNFSFGPQFFTTAFFSVNRYLFLYSFSFVDVGSRIASNLGPLLLSTG